MSRRSTWRRAAAALLLAGLSATVCAAADHTDGFEGAATSWDAYFERGTARVVGHTRSRANRHEGESAELLDIEAYAAATEIRLEHKLPPARLIEELSLSLWMHSNQDGVRLMVRVVLPRQIDPRDGRTMNVLLDGESYTKVDQWQQISCRGAKAQLKSLMPVLRKALKNETNERHDIDDSGAYIDAVVLAIAMDRARSRFFIDDLRFGPIVDASAERELQQATAAEPAGRPEHEFKIGGRLYVNGQPCFPRIVPYHGEKPEELARMRFNVAWVPDYQDVALLGELRQNGLRAMAIPPRPMTADGSPLDPESAQIVPFKSDTAPILFWYLGTRVRSDARRQVDQWYEQIRNADSVYARPVTADVVSQERAFSKQLEMLSVSRPSLQTTFGLRASRDWLIERRMLAKPGCFLWTWLATEPAAGVNPQRQAAGLSPLVFEPEQLRLQTYAALAAGYRGLGFWTHTPLDSDEPGAMERRLTLAQLNLEIDLIEPWLATGTLTGHKEFTAQIPPPRKYDTLHFPGGGARSQAERQGMNADRKDQVSHREQISRDLEVAILRTAQGTLVLPVWYADDALFVPGQMAVNNARIVVPGPGEGTRAWEVSTTHIAELRTHRVAGGKEIALKKFDMTAIILFTDDESLVETLRAKIQSIAEASSRIGLELARAKFQRVVAVDRKLQEYQKAPTDSHWLLASAERKLDQAEQLWQARRFHESREHSADCMQLLRILQHASWTDAVDRLYSPVSSPHTLCYQTLPDHWEMIARHGRARHAGGPDLLKSGDFEELVTMVHEGWKHEQVEVRGVRAIAELYPKPRREGGTYCLRLIATAATGQDPPPQINERPVTVTTPPVTVYKGQLVHISGWVKVAAPSLRNLDGAILYDSIGGPSTALRWRSKTDWQPFDLVREAPHTGDLTITMALTGLGEICFDDLKIIALDTDEEPRSPGATPAATPARGGPFDLFKRLRKEKEKEKVEPGGS